MPPDSNTYPQPSETAYVLREASSPSGSAFPSSSATIFKYNPHRMSPAEVLETFVGREELLARLVAHIRSEKGVTSPKHVFLYGPRGIGKTTMLLALRYAIGKDPGLSAGLDTIQFSEEERRIANLPSFAIRTLELLAGVRGEVKTDLEAARKTPATAFGILMKAAARQTGRPVLLLLDNFDDLAIAITSAKSKQFDARKIRPLESLKQLLRSPHFLVVATALQAPARKKTFPKALLSCFDPMIELPPLTDPVGFLKKRAVCDRREGFLRELPGLAGRIDGLNRLAGGNPRLLVFLYDCLGDHPLLDLVEIVQRTVDDLTPMYQDVILRLLNRSQAAVLETLAAAGGVGSVKEIARHTFLEEPSVRTFLGDLCNLGLAVRATPGPSDKASLGEPQVYRTYPPLFQIWYEMRHLGREHSLYLVRFLAFLTESREARQALQQIQNQPPAPVAQHLQNLMSDVVDLLDPEWDGIRKQYVDDILQKGGSLKDALSALDGVIAQPLSGLSLHRTGLLVVRSQVKLNHGDPAGAEKDLIEAESALPSSAGVETAIKIKIAWSRLWERSGDSGRAIEAAQSAVQRCDGLANLGSRTLRASAFWALAHVQQAHSDCQKALQFAQSADQLLGDEDALPLKARIFHLIGMIYRDQADYAQAVQYCQKALEIQRRIGDRRGETTSLNTQGSVESLLGDYDRARDTLETSLAIAEQIGDRRVEANALNHLANVCLRRGDYAGARKYSAKSLAIRLQIGDWRGEASSLSILGGSCHSMGDYAQAREHFEKALKIQQEINDRRGEADSLNNLGCVCHSLGEYSRAREYFEKSLTIRKQISHQSGVATLLSNLGGVCQSQGDFVLARSYFQESLTIRRQIGDRSGEADSLRNLGNTFHSLCDHTKAREFYEKSFAIQRQIGDRRGEVASLNGLGDVCSSLSDYAPARECYEKALAIEREIGDRSGEAASLRGLGAVFSSLGDYARARDHYQTSLAIQQEMGDRSGEAASFLSLGNVCSLLGNYARAQEYYRKSLAIQQQIGDRSGEASSLSCLGNAFSSLGDCALAAEYYEKALAIQQQIGDRSSEAASLSNLGGLNILQGFCARALEYCEKSLAIQQRIGDRSGEAISLHNCGSAYQHLGDYTRAKRSFEESLAIKKQLGERHGEARTLAALGSIAQREGNLKDALEHFREAHRLFTSLGTRSEIQESAEIAVSTVLQLGCGSLLKNDIIQTSALVSEGLDLAADAGAESFLNSFVKMLIVPCLQQSLELSVPLLPLIEQVERHLVFAQPPPALNSVKALVQYYANNRQSEALNTLGPTEMVLVKSLKDQVERPEHAQARELLAGGKPAEARAILEAIVDRTPNDLEALAHLASALVAQNELDLAETRIKTILTRHPDFSPALLQLAQIEERRGRFEPAIEILKKLREKAPRRLEAYPPLARLLRRQERFPELAGVLGQWRDLLDDPIQRQPIEVWITEAHLLAGDIARAKVSLPNAAVVPADPGIRTLLGFIRVFLALHAKDSETARAQAAAVLEFVSDSPAGKVPMPLTPALEARAKEFLGENELRFLLALAQALGHAVNPVDFSRQFLSETETKALAERVTEEGTMALKALRDGRIQGFRDLFQITTRGIGPTAGLAALGDAYADLSAAQKNIVLEILAAAIRQSPPMEAAAGLVAVAKNFPRFQPPERIKCLDAVLDLATQPEAAPICREKAVRLLNILYPNLTPSERADARSGLDKARQQGESPALAEFFNETVPQFDRPEKP